MGFDIRRTTFALITSLAAASPLKAQESCPAPLSISVPTAIPASEAARLDYPEPVVGAIGDAINDKGEAKPDGIREFLAVGQTSTNDGYVIEEVNGASGSPFRAVTIPYTYYARDYYYSGYVSDNFVECDEDGKNCGSVGSHPGLGNWRKDWSNIWGNYASQLRVTFAQSVGADLNGDGVEEFAVGTRCVPAAVNSSGGRYWPSQTCCFEKGGLNVYDGATSQKIYSYSPDRGRPPYWWGWAGYDTSYYGFFRTPFYTWYWRGYGLWCDGQWGNKQGFYATAYNDGKGTKKLVIGDPELKKVIVQDIALSGATLTPVQTRYLDPTTDDRYTTTQEFEGQIFTVSLFQTFQSLGATLTILKDKNGAPPLVVVGDPRYSIGNDANGGGALMFFNFPDGSPINRVNKIVPDFGQAHLGYSVKNVGDLNGDGMDDLLVGAPGNTNLTALDGGVTTVINGKTLRPMQFSPLPGDRSEKLFRGDGELAQFGYSVDGGDDIDGDPDKQLDLLIGSPGDEDGVGLVRVFSGKDKSLLYELSGSDTGQRFGQGVASLGSGRIVVADAKGKLQLISLGTDSNGDGIPDRCQADVTKIDTGDPKQLAKLLNQLSTLSARTISALNGIRILTSGTLKDGVRIPVINVKPPYHFSSGSAKHAYIANAITKAMNLVTKNMATITQILTDNQPALGNYHRNLRASMVTALNREFDALNSSSGKTQGTRATRLAKRLESVRIGARPKKSKKTRSLAK